MVLGDVRSEDEGSDGGKLDEDVDGWSGGVLEWVTDGVTDNSSNVAFSKISLLENPDADLLGSFVFGITLSFELFVFLLVGGDVSTGSVAFSFVCGTSSFSLLLGVIPGSSSVGGGDGNLDT